MVTSAFLGMRQIAVKFVAKLDKSALVILPLTCAPCRAHFLLYNNGFVTQKEKNYGKMSKLWSGTQKAGR